MAESSLPNPSNSDHNIGHKNLISNQKNKFIKQVKEKKPQFVERIKFMFAQDKIGMAFFVGSLSWFKNQNLSQYVLNRDLIVDNKTWNSIYSSDIVRMFQPIVTKTTAYVYVGKVLLMTKNEWKYALPKGKAEKSLVRYQRWNLDGKLYTVFFTWDHFLEHYTYENDIPIVVTNSNVPRKDLMIFNPISVKYDELKEHTLDTFTKMLDIKGKYFFQYPSMKATKLLKIGDILDEREQEIWSQVITGARPFDSIDSASELSKLVATLIRVKPRQDTAAASRRVSAALKCMIENGSLPRHTPLSFEMLTELFDLEPLSNDYQLFWSELMAINKTFKISVRMATPSSTIIRELSNISVSVLNPDVFAQPDGIKKIIGTKLSLADVNSLGMYSDGIDILPEGVVTTMCLQDIDYNLVRKSINVAWAFRGVLIVGGLKGTGKSSLASMLKKNLPNNYVIDSDDYLKCEEVRLLNGGKNVYETLRTIYPDAGIEPQYYEAMAYLRKLIRSSDYRDAIVAYTKRFFGGVTHEWSKRVIFVHSMEEADYLCTALSPYIKQIKKAETLQLRAFQLPSLVFSKTRNTHIDLLMNDVFRSSMTSVEIYSLRDIYNGILLGNRVDHPVIHSATVLVDDDSAPIG